jgi:hypothetical protein
MNPSTKDILHHMMKGLKCYENWYRTGDMDSFVEDFQLSAEHLGDFCGEAYEESSEILDFTVRLANRNKHS